MIDLSRSLDAKIVRHASVYPTHRKPDVPNRLFMGVFDQEGSLVDGSLLDRRSGEVGAPVEIRQLPDPVDAPSPAGIYCGVLYYHFGHFLVESMARLWYAARYPDLPLIWAGASNWAPQALLKGWQQEILRLLGIRNPVIIVTTPSRFQELHVPEVGYRYDDQFHPEHARFLGGYEGPSQVAGSRLWLSRSRISSDVRDLNALTLERRISEVGWRVIYPESMSIQEQLDSLAQAEVIAGEEGSAFHLLMLLKDVTNKRCRIIRRLGNEHRNMHTVGDAIGLTQSFHTLENEAVVAARGRYVTKISANASEILDILEVPIVRGRGGSTEAPLDSCRRFVGEVLSVIKPDTYLELGVDDPSIIAGSEVPVRRTISANFSFDPRVYRDTGVEFYELPVPQYFAGYGDSARYDLIRVGTCSADETFGLVCASMVNSHGSTVWLLDDVMSAAGGKAWLGVLRLLDAFPSLLAHTVVCEDSSQTLLWQEPRGRYVPVAPQGGDGGSFETLSNEAREALAIVTEERAPTVLAGLAGFLRSKAG